MPKQLLAAIRGHWGIENSVHWVLDIAFREDESRIRQGYAQHNMAFLRRMALNLLCHENSAKIGIAAERKRAGWRIDYLLKALEQQDAIALIAPPGPAPFTAVSLLIPLFCSRLTLAEEVK